jgi:hypothetical protein
LVRKTAYRRLNQLLLSGVCVVLLSAAAEAAAMAPSALVLELLNAADHDQCIENLVFQTIRQNGPQLASAVVQAAAIAQAQRAHQQRALGCEGDIAAQAIAAGADPDVVLKATAAGL